MRFFYNLMAWLRRTAWALIVAYMLGMHNFYYGDNKTADNIRIVIEYKEDQANGTPKD